MPKITEVEISKLKLDLENYRTVPQKKELDAINAMITVSPDKFYGIINSLLKGGYRPAENIIVLKKGNLFIVKEGNRRIAALKLLHGLHKIKDDAKLNRIISSIDKIWKKKNSKVPCAIYNEKEESEVNKIVALTHGKGEEASRDDWNSVAKARHNRDAKSVAEPALDLLEAYLKHSKSLTDILKEKWAGLYPLTILQDALRILCPRLGYKNVEELVKKYPSIKQVKDIDSLLFDIGNGKVNFKTIRSVNKDFAVDYGAKPIANNKNTTNQSKYLINNPASNTNNSSAQNNSNSNQKNSLTKNKNLNAFATDDPKNVIRLLKKLEPKGKREKVVTIVNEIVKLKINDHPIAFCFLLRSIFEISAKVFCHENKISVSYINKKGITQDLSLKELLEAICKHLIAISNNNKEKIKELHGAKTELTKSDGILSCTSLNQLVHSHSFSIPPSDICTIFSNIYPLLEAIN